jgi:hypothetical protein
MTTDAAARLRAAGEAIHGRDWQSPLARDLRVDARTVRFWTAGERPVPAAVIMRLPDVLRGAADARHAEGDALSLLAREILRST